MSGTPLQLPPDLQVDPPPPPSGTATPVRPLGDRSRVAVVALGLIAIVAAIGIFTDLDQVRLLDRILHGERVTLSDAQSSDDRANTVGVIYTVSFILTAFAFLLWYARAYRNVIGMGINPRYGTGWAIGYWFIPFVTWVRPKQVMNDIWRGSDPDLPAPARGWLQVAVHPLLHVWWAVWLIDTFVSRYAVGQILDDHSTVKELHDRAVAYVVSDVLDVIAAGLAIAVIVKITRRHEERRARYEAGTLNAVDQPPAEPLASPSAG